jgi:hypothetical protein
MGEDLAEQGNRLMQAYTARALRVRRTTAVVTDVPEAK